jgi:hypothetical protein
MKRLTDAIKDRFNRARRIRYFWICLGAIFAAELAVTPVKKAEASFGAEIPILINILTQAITQVRNLQLIVGTARDTVSILQEMNRGVKEVLRLARTAHVPLPRQVLDMADSIDAATREAESLYGMIPGSAPTYIGATYRVGTEGLYMSQDAFEYSAALDVAGERIKESSIVASQASATRLTAESMGVLIHAVSHGNRISAKNLEMTSTARIEEAAKENARFESFLSSQSQVEEHLRRGNAPQINSFFGDETAPSGVGREEVVP